MRRLLTLAAITALLAAVCAVPAAAKAPASDPVADCNAHNTLTQHYSPGQLQHGLATMDADVREYTDCYDVLHRALMAELAAVHGGGGGGGGGGGSVLPAPVLAVLVALVVAAGGLGVVALRRRSTGDASG